MMSELLERAAIDGIAGPVVIGLPASAVPMTKAFSRWSYEAKLVWVVPGAEVVKVIVRQSPEQWATPFVQPIPKDGPLALQELPEWAPSEVVYRELVAALVCPSCEAAATRYRQIRDALVCLECGRSFEHQVH